MVEDFKLETLLTIITGYDFTDNFEDVYKFAWHIYDDPFITYGEMMSRHKEMKEHIFSSYPKLKEINYIPSKITLHSLWISVQKEKYGEYFSIPKITKEKTLTKKKKSSYTLFIFLNTIYKCII